MIEAIGLVKQYGDHVAVDHLNFTVEKGQILGFLGPNGAGKSTTMNMLTGYISATEGTILVNGYDMLEEPELAKKSIGYLPEQPPVYPDMTVEEYLKFVTELKKVPRKEREMEVDRVIGMTQLEPMRERLIQHLSKGYRQRVGIAQALVGNPEVIILDEPTVGLDPKQIIEIRDLMKSLAKEHTVLLSSHIMQEISAVCDHIMIISHGKLVLSGTPEELQQKANQGEHLDLEAIGDRDKVMEIVNSVSGIASVEELAGERDTHVALRLKGTQDVREALFFAFAKANLPIVKLVRTTKTLEDIFLEATSGNFEYSGETEFDEAEDATPAETTEQKTEEKEASENVSDL